MSHSNRDNGVSAIFIHAGAGFHSKENEQSHLKLCENAAKVAMALLRSGGTAVDAVEIAIMLLEDAEITNAGYGSNPNINGIVECDATIVDHLGRSGAAGAVPQVKNPISLARIILNSTTKELSLNRVPPNLLVGPGAVEYAYENGLVVLPHDGLLSEGATHRWRRWQKEMLAAETAKEKDSPNQNSNNMAYYRRPLTVNPTPILSTPSSTGPGSSTILSSPRASPSPRVSPAPSGKIVTAESMDIANGSHVDGTSQPRPGSGRSSATKTRQPNPLRKRVRLSSAKHVHDVDQISDTVGAIAVDSYGNIAAGSSSGGIGMKHQGRVGPAALVGVGTHVIPSDPNDPEQTCVATVTSGTGEHIATTMAASVCATRVYYSHRKCENGTFDDVSEDEAIRAMITADFMMHPAVKPSHHQGCIGVMTVKKSVDGIALYFAHNTDSFALASMTSKDRRPVSVMSRSNGKGSIAQGGRACVFRS